MKSGSIGAFSAAAELPDRDDENGIENDDPFRRWFNTLGALDVLDWSLVEQPSDQYRAGRWEVLVEYSDGRTAWILAPADLFHR